MGFFHLDTFLYKCNVGYKNVLFLSCDCNAKIKQPKIREAVFAFCMRGL